MNFVTRVAGNILALYIASLFVSGFTVSGGFTNFLIAGLVLALLNTVVKPAIKILAFPLIIVTLGLLLIAVNAFILWILTRLFAFVTLESLVSLLWATIIISVVNFIFATTLRKTEK